MTERLVNGWHRVVGFDLNPDSVQGVAGVGAEGAGTLEEFRPHCRHHLAHH